MVKVDIISGFLGAGKTTFIKKMLSEVWANEKVVLIENEYGEIGIDGGFLKSSGIEIKEMNSGCICCSLVGDFEASLKEVLNKYEAEHIVIEPSGVGKLSDVMNAVKTALKDTDAQLNSIVAIVDVIKCKMYMKNFGEFYKNQIQNAKTIILSRTDIADEKKIKTCVEMIRELNDFADIITTPCEKLEGKRIQEVMEGNNDLTKKLLEEVKEEHHHHGDGECCHGEHHHHGDGECCHGEHHHHEDGECCHGEHHHHEDGECCHGEHHHKDGECCHGKHHHHEDGECCHGEHHHHEADEVFVSWGKETMDKYSESQLNEILEKIQNNDEYGTILRAKGIVANEEAEDWIYYDLVPGEYKIWIGKPDFTGKICVIGANLSKEKLEDLFGGK